MLEHETCIKAFTSNYEPQHPAHCVSLPQLYF